MWINPKYRQQAGGPSEQLPAVRQRPPGEQGTVLAVLPRHGGEEMHVSLCDYNGHPYVSLRVWAPGTDGQLWPMKARGCSVRVKEIMPVARALAEALKLIGADAGGSQPPQRRPSGEAPGRAYSLGDQPPAGPRAQHRPSQGRGGGTSNGSQRGQTQDDPPTRNDAGAGEFDEFL
jgi:hypothetical protein